MNREPETPLPGRQADEPPLRVSALHALIYCERLFYLEEVEEIRLADENVYAGRTLHEELAAEEGDRVESLSLASNSLGLVGRTDAVRRRDGVWFPYEHKRGRPFRTKDGVVKAWPSDEVQVAAYGILLEEHLGHAVLEGRVRYHSEGVTVRVPLDSAAREGVAAAIGRARALRASLDRPPVTTEAARCLRCSLAPVCLPEEERLAVRADWEPVRLFPPLREGQVVHLLSNRGQAGRSGDTLVVRREGEADAVIPIRNIDSVVVHGYAQVTTQAIHLCAANGVAVHWISGGGRYLAGLANSAGGVQRRIRQYSALTDPATAFHLAQRLVLARTGSQLRYLLRSTRSDPVLRAAAMPHLTEIRSAMRGTVRAQDPDSLRGFEGAAGRAYFGALPLLVSDDLAAPFRPAGRSRRPPRDRFNALLSFGYALLYRSVLQAALAVGLEPALGFFHTPRSSAYPLVLDMMELFRVPVCDVAVLGSVNRRHWDAKADFAVTGDQVWLSDSGRRKAIELFEGRLQDSWRHPVTQYSLSWERAIELEFRLLEKEWTGQPGLFGQSRLR